jgi:uncharacterized Rmd1/YagE family protein
MEPWFGHVRRIKARAMLLSQWIDTRLIERADVLAVSPIVTRVGPTSFAVIKKYGAVVLFNATAVEEADFLGQISGLLSEPYDVPEVEELIIEIVEDDRETVHNGVCRLAQITVEHLQIAGETLGKSATLAFYEKRIAAQFDKIEPIAAHLQEHGSRRVDEQGLIKHLGGVLMDEQNMIGQVEVGEKPEVLWDYPHLERFYKRLEEEFEIRDRHQALTKKIETIHRTVETILRISEAARSIRVEWYIVILILFEICLSIYALFFQG